MTRAWMKLAATFAIACAATFALLTVLDPNARLRRCCIRFAPDAVAASAELQQAVASAIVQNGATITALRAPPSYADSSLRWQSLDVSLSGTEDEVRSAANQIALMSPQVLVINLGAERGADQRIALHMRLVQLVRPGASSSR